MCPVGRYNTDEGLMIDKHDTDDDCLPCPTGRYANANTDPWLCKICPTGKMMAEGITGSINSSNCKVCGTGKFSMPADEGVACQTCPV